MYHFYAKHSTNFYGKVNLLLKILCVSHYLIVIFLQILHQFVTNCLNMAVNSYGYKSIAFPSLGTGRLDYPPGQVAREMFNAVATHYQSNPQSTLQDVLFVLYHRDYATVAVII